MKQSVDFRTDKSRRQLVALLEEANASFNKALQEPDSHLTDKSRGLYVLGYVQGSTKL